MSFELRGGSLIWNSQHVFEFKRLDVIGDIPNPILDQTPRPPLKPHDYIELPELKWTRGHNAIAHLIIRGATILRAPQDGPVRVENGLLALEYQTPTLPIAADGTEFQELRLEFTAPAPYWVFVTSTVQCSGHADVRGYEKRTYPGDKSPVTLKWRNSVRHESDKPLWAEVTISGEVGIDEKLIPPQPKGVLSKLRNHETKIPARGELYQTISTRLACGRLIPFEQRLDIRPEQIEMVV